MDRRWFLKLLGMTTAGLVLDPEAVFPNPVDAVTGQVTDLGLLATQRAWVFEVKWTARESGIYTLVRTHPDMSRTPLIQLAAGEGAHTIWEANLGQEFVLPVGHGLELEGPQGVQDWAACWVDDQDAVRSVGVWNNVRFADRMAL